MTVLPPNPTAAQPPLVYLVDDEDVIRDALAWLLRSRRLSSEGYASAEAFESMLERSTAAPSEQPGAPSPAQQAPWHHGPSCLLLDVRMPGVSGLVLFERLRQRGLTELMPVIFLTGHGDVPTAVSAVKRGAFDFVEKPFSDNALVDRVEQALAHSTHVLAQRRARHGVQQRVLELTEREREVMHCVADGLPNKQIAAQLDISVRTVEVHRARLFDKMAVKSAVELANLLRSPEP